MEAAQDVRPLEPGTMLDDKYRIERLLAVGGMGAVYEGTHTKLRKRVAIKVTVRRYRNSREDVLHTGDAQPGAMFETSITVDGLAGDRILVAMGGAQAGPNNGLQMFVSGTGAAFPQSRQVALSFSAAMGAGWDNLCGGDYKGTNLLVKNADTTTQFWVRYDGPVGGGDAWVFSDHDLDNTGGIGVVTYENGGRFLEVSTCTGAGNPLQFKGDMTPYPTDTAWHFVRIVHKGALVSVCLDGQKKFSFAAPAGSLESKFRPHLGRNVVWTPAGAFTDASLDDVRVFTGALPCE